MSYTQHRNGPKLDPNNVGKHKLDSSQGIKPEAPRGHSGESQDDSVTTCPRYLKASWGNCTPLIKNCLVVHLNFSNLAFGIEENQTRTNVQKETCLTPNQCKTRTSSANSFKSSSTTCCTASCRANPRARVSPVSLSVFRSLSLSLSLYVRFPAHVIFQ